eukprot:SAG11_NODE_20215_length_450_cov_0.877493_2_plen_25_part_01
MDGRVITKTHVDVQGNNGALDTKSD